MVFGVEIFYAFNQAKVADQSPAIDLFYTGECK